MRPVAAPPRLPGPRADGLRRLVRGGLLVLLPGLLPITACGGDEAGAPPADPPAAQASVGPPLQVLVRDAVGAPVKGAVVRTRQRAGSALPEGGAWDDALAALTLPAGAPVESVLALAPGYRLARRDGVAGDVVLTLQPGLGLRVELDADGPPPPDPLRLVLRVRPAPAAEGGPADVPADLLVDGVGRREPPVEPALVLPRGSFGFAVDHRDAARGLLLPAPGAWDVRWGLLDTTVGAWFSLDEGATLRFLVEESDAVQAVAVRVSAGDLERTLAGLKARVAEIAGR